MNDMMGRALHTQPARGEAAEPDRPDEHSSHTTNGSEDWNGLWAQVRAGLKRDLGTRSFDNWLARVQLAGFCATDGAITLTLPSAFQANWVNNNFGDRLRIAWRSAAPQVRHVRIDVDARRDARMDASAPQAMTGPCAMAGGRAIVVAPEGGATALATTPQGFAPSNRCDPPAGGEGDAAAPLCRFDPRMSLARFVVGDANRVAANAVRAVAEGGAIRFNPLFLHSATGQGKTHLLHATGQAFLAANPGARALILSAERFMVEFVHAMRARDTFTFKARLRSVDLLMIDDFQFIAGKETTQEEFLYTIDALTSGQGKLVIAADRPPHAFDSIDPRILSRLTQGLVVDIQPANLALRRAILAAKAENAPIAIPHAVLDLLAARITSSVRELEGALNRLTAYAALNGRQMDTVFAEEVLGEMFRAHRRRLTIEEIQKQVAIHFQMRQADLLSARRTRVIARPRQIAMYLAKQLTPRSLPEIGRRFGGRDHTTVIHAVRQIERLRVEDTEIDGHVRALMRVLEG